MSIELGATAAAATECLEFTHQRTTIRGVKPAIDGSSGLHST